MSTETQMYREVPFHRFSPWEPRKELPDGAFLGQVIETPTSDNAAYRVMKNGPDALGNLPVPLEIQFTEVFHNTNGSHNLIQEKYDRGTNALQIGSNNTKIDENQFVGGIFYKTDGDSQTFGQSHVVTHNKESIAGTQDWDYLTDFYIDPPLFSDWDDEPAGNIVMHPLNGVTASTTGQGAVCGVSVGPVPAGYYFLGLIRGIVQLRSESMTAPIGTISKSHTNATRVKKSLPGEQVIGHHLENSQVSLTSGYHNFYINLLSNR